jgi:two-component system KDP operon response regulator KdpE
MSGPAIKILVVDDEPPIRRLLRTGLGTQGYAIAEVADVAAAHAHLKSENPDLVLLDLGLPGRNGLELLHLRGRHDVPVVVLSSRTDEVGIVEDARARRR